MQSSPRAEMIDVVDLDDQRIATVTRAEMRAGRLRHRAVYIAVIDPDGRLLVHRRSELKDLWPGRWDIAVGGVVSAGERYDDAARRELREEVGVEAVLESLGGLRTYDDDDVSLIGRCYRAVHPGPFTFDDGEVVHAEWADIEAVALNDTGRQFVPDSLELLMPLLARRF